MEKKRKNLFDCETAKVDFSIILWLSFRENVIFFPKE